MKNKNLEIANLRKYIEEKLQKMLRRNITRTKFAERFRTSLTSTTLVALKTMIFMRNF